MRRLCRLATGAGLVAMLALGCGSSAEDAAVMRFVGFDASDISQPDTVTATSAEVCVNNPNLSGDLTQLPPTLINAIFVNEEEANIHLESYTVHFNDSSSGVADVTADIPGNPDLPGGICTDGFTHCAVAADCAASSSSGGGGSSGGTTTCDHTQTVVGGLVLIDSEIKAHVNPKLYGQTLSLTLTFAGKDDANRTFVVEAGYAVVFSDSLDCGSISVLTPTSTVVATVTPSPTPIPTATPVVS